MLMSWLRNRWRRRLLATPFPDTWLAFLRKNVAVYRLLTEAERGRLCDALRVMVAERNWEGCGGLVLTDAIKVTVAGQAALLLLGLEHDYFSRVPSILIYPSGYRAPADRDGDVHEGRLGEAWYRGPVVLAWDAVLAGTQDRDHGRNLVLHEFAHQLDFLDGYADGTPPLETNARRRRWHDVMTTEYERLIRESEHGHSMVLDEYGTRNPAEFFAVVTECFFGRAVLMKRRHPELYALLKDYYKQDPADRLAHYTS
jgi:Mlc titration factor MtfA (ptsG expression regulator)